MICWICWTDVPVVPDSFHPYFPRSKRAHGKQCILIESCLTQKRLSLQGKTGTIKELSKIATYTTENCHSPSYTATNDARERESAQDQTAHLNSAIRANSLRFAKTCSGPLQCDLFPIRELPRSFASGSLTASAVIAYDISVFECIWSLGGDKVI